MDRYCLNRNQQVGHGYNHEVHKSWCSHRPLPSNQIDLGYCYSDEEALRKAKQYYSDADGCAYCCPSIVNVPNSARLIERLRLPLLP